MLFLFENATYWMARNYYQAQNCQDFINAFGNCFEDYVQELLNNYLKPNQYEKIPETSQKRADWKIKLGDYVFLISWGLIPRPSGAYPYKT